jgi:phosphoribosylanthranilate isomerase
MGIKSAAMLALQGSRSSTTSQRLNQRNLNRQALDMPSIRIKICGVTTPEDARFAAEAGADAVGLNFYEHSPRFIPLSVAAEIIRVLPPFTAPVGVFIGMQMRQICSVSYQLGLRAIQTYDIGVLAEDPFPFAHVAAFRVKEESELDNIQLYVERVSSLGRKPAAILIDSRVDGQLGGTGQVAPWSILAGFNPGVPLILAGGLTPENVADAIAIVRPWGVDVASGLEASPGRKDPLKVAQFIKSVRALEG